MDKVQISVIFLITALIGSGFILSGGSSVSGETEVGGDDIWINETNTTAESFEFEGIGSPQTAGEAFSITITAYDETGNVSEDYNGSAALTEDTGTLEPDMTDNFTAGVWVGNVTITEAMDNITIRAEDGNVSGESGAFDVEAAESDHILIHPENKTITTGESVVYTAAVYDEYGNEVKEVTANTTWSIEEGAGGSWDENVYTSENPGDWIVNGEYKNMSADADLTVEPEKYFGFDEIDSPQTAGEPFEITISAYDENGTLIGDYNGSVRLNDTSGSIEPTMITFENGTWTGNVTIYKAGEEVRITAVSTDGEIIGESGVFEVEAGAPVFLQIGPEESSVKAGEVQEYWARAFDNHDNGFNVTSETNWSDDLDEATWVDNEITPLSAGEGVIRGGYEGLEGEAVLFVEPGEAESIEISAQEESIMSGMSVEFFSKAYDRYDNEIGNVTDEVEWSIENGAGGEWEGNTYTAGNVGVWKVTGTYDGLEDTIELTVEELDPDHISITPGESTVAAGETQEFSATAYDENGVKIAEMSERISWSIEDGAGGSWNGNVYSAKYAGEWTVEGNYEGNTDTATLNVEPGEVDSIVVTPRETTVKAGEKQSFDSIAYDQFSNEIGGVTGESEWSIEDGAKGSWNGNVYTSEKAGRWTVSAEYEGFTDSVRLTVEVGPADEVEIQPGGRNVTAGQSIRYSAFAYDQFGNEVGDVTGKTNWSIDDGARGRWDGSVYTSEKAGRWTVKGTYAEISGTGTLTVEPGEAERVIIDPREDKTVEAGETLNFQAEAYDTYNNTITENATDFSWRNAEGGVFVEDEEGTYNVSAEYDGVTSSTVTVTVEEEEGPSEGWGLFDAFGSGYWWLILILIGVAAIVISGIGVLLSGGKAS